MPDARRRTATPWIVAGAVGLLVAALVVTYVALRSYRKDFNPGALGSNEKAALAAARTDVTHLLSFSRAHFDEDFRRAVASATGPLKSDISSRRSLTLQTITKGNFDLVVEVTHTALVGPADKGASGSSYVVLVTTQGYPSTNKTDLTLQNLRVTIQKVKGTWLLSDVVNVGLT